MRLFLTICVAVAVSHETGPEATVSTGPGLDAEDTPSESPDSAGSVSDNLKSSESVQELQTTRMSKVRDYFASHFTATSGLEVAFNRLRDAPGSVNAPEWLKKLPISIENMAGLVTLLMALFGDRSMYTHTGTAGRAAFLLSSTAVKHRLDQWLDGETPTDHTLKNLHEWLHKLRKNRPYMFYMIWIMLNLQAMRYSYMENWGVA